MPLVPFEFDTPKGAALSIALIAAVCLWFTTAVVNVVEFKDTDKVDVLLAPSTAWTTALVLLALSTLSLVATLTCIAVTIYGVTNDEGGVSEDVTKAKDTLKRAQEAEKTAEKTARTAKTAATAATVATKPAAVPVVVAKLPEKALANLFAP